MRQKKMDLNYSKIFKNIENLFFKLVEIGNKCIFFFFSLLKFRSPKIKEIHNAFLRGTNDYTIPV